MVCPVYRVTGQEAHTARGKIHLVHVPELRGKGDVFEEIFSTCLLCGACATVCPRGINVCREVVQVRSAFPAVYGAHGTEKYLVRKALVHPGLLTVLGVVGRVGADFLLRHLPVESGLRLRLAMFPQDRGGVTGREVAEASSLKLGVNECDVPRTSVTSRKKESLIYFPGCAARYLFPEIVMSCDSLAAAFDHALHVPEGLSCCGLAALSAGDMMAARRCARNNIAVLEQSVGPILISCASCYAHLRRYGELFEDDPAWRLKAEAMGERLVELSCFLDQHMPLGFLKQSVGKKKVRVYYHDPCHFRHGGDGVKIIAEPRMALGRNPDLELLELPDGPECCGQGGLFHIGAPGISAVIRDTLAAKVLALAPDVITTTCSGCLMQWRLAVEVAGSRVKVLHLAELLELS